VSTKSSNDLLCTESAVLFAAADKLPPGSQRDKVLQKALETEITSIMQRWIKPPELHPPSTV
jgi:hypothetical protein